MTRIVSLGMYDPGNGSVERLWTDIGAELTDSGIADVPPEVSRKPLEDAWLDGDLLLAQTCGYPLRHALDGKVRYVGTPVYAVEGTEGANYRSAIVVRAADPARSLSDLRGRRAAYNSRQSQSGYNSLREAASELATAGRFFAGLVETGSHASSLRSVIEGRADVAAIDPVSLALTPETIRDGVRIVGWTAPAPGLPFITAANTADMVVSALRDTLSRFLHGEGRARHPAFRFAGFDVLPDDAYDVILTMEQRAIERSYPVLA